MTKGKLSAVKRGVDPDIIRLLEAALDQARQGQIHGLVMLLNRPGAEYQFASAGDMKMSEVIMAYESWKFDQHLLAAGIKTK